MGWICSLVAAALPLRPHGNAHDTPQSTERPSIENSTGAGCKSGGLILGQFDLNRGIHLELSSPPMKKAEDSEGF